MRIGTQLKRRDSAIQSLNDMFSQAEFCSCSSQWMDEYYNTRIIRKLEGCPESIYAFVQGYKRAMDDEMYRYKLVFGGLYNEKFLSIHRDRDDYYEKNGMDLFDYSDDGRIKQRGHYWKENLKPFFIVKANRL